MSKVKTQNYNSKFKIFLNTSCFFLTFIGLFFITGEFKKAQAVTRQSYYAESLSESSTTSTSYQDKTTLTFTPDDNSTYLIIASWLQQENNTSYQSLAKLTRTTGTAKDFNEIIYQPRNTAEYISGGTIGIDTFGSSPGSQTYKIQYRSSNTSGTARIKEAKIIAIKLGSNDQYAESEARSTTTSTSYQDKTTLTFTPPSQDDYIIIASATCDGSSVSYDFRAQLTIGASIYTNYNIEPVAAANRHPWLMVKRANLAASSQTIKIQYSSENTGATAGIAHARIVALRASDFDNNYYAEVEARTTTTSNSFQTRTTLNQTPYAVSHLVIASAGVDTSSTSVSVEAQLIKGSDNYGTANWQTRDTSGQGFPYFTIKRETLSKTSTTWNLQYRIAGSATAGIKDARISVIQLEDTPKISISGSSDLTSGTVALAINSSLGVGYTAAISSGSWTISNVIQPDTNDIITTWVDGADTADESTAVTKYDGSGNITDMVLNKHTLSLGSSDSSVSLTVTNLGLYDNDQDEDIMHSANSGTLNVDDDNAYSDEKIDILSGTTLTIGGSETLTTYDIAINGTLTSGGNSTYNISGSWDNNATFNCSTSTVYFNASSGTQIIDSSGSSTNTFYNLQHTGAGTLQLNSALDVNGAFSQTSGTFNCNSQNQNFAGNFSLSSGTTYTKGGTLTFDGSGSSTFSDATSGQQDLGTVVVDGSSKTITTSTNIKLTSLTIGNDDTLNITDDTLTILGSGTPLTKNGTLTTTNSTVIYAGTSATNVTTTAYHNLTFTPASGTATYSLTGNLTSSNALTGNLTISSGATLTTTGSNYGITLAGNWSNSGTFTANASTVTFNKSSGTQTVNNGSSAFYHLVHSGAGTLQLDTNNLDVNGDFSQTLGAFNANSLNQNFAGNFSLSSGTTYTKGGTLTFDGSGTSTVTDNNNSIKQNLGTVLVDGSSKTVNLGSDITVDKLTLGSDDTLGLGSSGYTLLIKGSGTGASRPFLINSGGTLNEGTDSTVKFDTNAGPTEIQAETYWHLSLQPADSGNPTYRLGTASSQTINVSGNLTVGDGTNAVTIDWDTYDPTLNIAGNLTLNSNSTWTKSNSATLTFNGSSLGLIADQTSSGQDLGAVVVDGSSKSVATNTNIKLTTLTIGANDTFDISSDTLTILGSGTPFTIESGGTFTVSNSTVVYAGTNSTNITTTNYHNLTLDPASGTPTYSLTGNLTNSNALTGNLTISNDGTLTTTGNNYNITLAGSWDNNGTFTANNSTVTFNATSTGKTIEAGSSSFYDIIFNSSTGGWTIQTDNLTATHNFTITDTASSGFTVNGVTVEVQGTYSIADAETSNTTWTSATLYLNSGTAYTIGSKNQNAETYDTLQIGNNTDIRLWNSTANTFNVASSGSLYSQNHANTSGDLYIWSDYHTQANDYWSYNTDFDGTDISGSPRQVDVRVAPSSTVTVDSGDALEAIGTSSNRTTVSRQGASGGYNITVANGGTINFQYTNFDYLKGTTGLNIQEGAIVTSLDYTSFDNFVGSVATDDAYITVASSVIGSSTKTITGVNFDRTDTSVDFNINRTGSDDTGYWYFENSSGDFDGEAYDGKNGSDEADPGMLRWDDSNVAPQSPSSLLTEGETNPTNVDDFTPEFSAVYNDINIGDTANAYQIQVDDDPEFGSPIWDSEKQSMSDCLQGNRCQDISYSGPELTPGSTYYWRIKFWDIGGLEGTWSTEEAYFTLSSGKNEFRFREIKLKDLRMKPSN